MSELRQRDIPHRDNRLRDSARGKPCLYHTNCIVDRRSVCWCHSNQSKHGKGGARKAHDCMGFYGCMAANLPDRRARAVREEQENHAMRVTRSYIILHQIVEGATADDVHDDDRWLEGWRSGRIKVA